MNRRELLLTFPAAALVARPPELAASPAPTETSIAALFRAWERQTALVEAGSTDDNMSDENFEALMKRQTKIEDEIAITPALNLRDLAMKFYARSTGGVIDLPNADELPELWTDVRALIGGVA